jgi:hypothetical protein
MNEESEEPSASPDLEELLNVDRELSAEELDQVSRLGERTFAQVYRRLTGRARAVYAQASMEEFGECVSHHLDAAQRRALVHAEVFTCPYCHRLLKDRRTPVATAVELERGRVKDLWQQVETASPSTREAAFTRFRQALGLA